MPLTGADAKPLRSGGVSLAGRPADGPAAEEASPDSPDSSHTRKRPSHAKEHCSNARIDRIRARPQQSALTAPGAQDRAGVGLSRAGGRVTAVPPSAGPRHWSALSPRAARPRRPALRCSQVGLGWRQRAGLSCKDAISSKGPSSRDIIPAALCPWNDAHKNRYSR
jgi:hypothetical protein